ncbi:hypothetical protein [Xanthocytophaga flava]|uniref:hypothetical protein n=1 Tax=Xanthocytophaga flava TaxID=3048013 RepID=UPI0028D70A9F|nr:hypothetical protein [Xanthocytophaga flavus]MDJ1472087.1 hypothetical protein [Xanthocytophaga flavus]
MRQFRQLFLLAILALTVFACSKDDDPKPQTNADLLVAHSWRLTALSSDKPIPFVDEDDTTVITPISDLYNQYFPPCMRDDVFSFTSDGKYTIDDVGTSCGGDKISVFGTWFMSGDKDALVLTGGGYISYFTQNIENWTITELNSTSFKATTYLSSSTTAYTITYTFTAAD